MSSQLAARLRRAPLFPLLLLLASAADARAEVQTKGPQVWPGKHEISGHVGFQSGLGGYAVGGGPAGGIKLFTEYAYRIKDAGGPFSLWLDAGIGVTLGSGCDVLGGIGGYACSSYANGTAVEPFAGVKVKFRVLAVPIVPYVRANATYVAVLNRYCSDNAHVAAGHLGGGAKYFLTRNIGLGVELGFTMGPGFYAGAPSTTPACIRHHYLPHTELYATVDVTVGLEGAF